MNLASTARNAKALPLSPNTTQGNLTESQTADGLDQLSAEELKHLVRELRESQNLLEERRYIETVFAELAGIMRWRPEDTLQTWADRLLEAMAERVGALQACLYVQGSTVGELALAGTFAADLNSVASRIQVGSGVLGQAAKTGQAAYIAAEGGAFGSFSGVANLRPSFLAILPVAHNEHVEGVLELAAPMAFSPAAVSLLSRVCEAAAANLMTIRSQEATRRLFEESQERQEQLAAQEEEMRQNFEELQATQEEMNRIQRHLAESQGVLQAVMDANPALVSVKNPKGRFLLVNKAFAQAVGHTTEACLAKTEAELGISDATELGFADLSALEGTPVQNPGEEKFGRVFNTHLMPLVLQDGSRAGIICISTDITELKRNEEMVQRQSSIMRSVLDGSNDTIVMVDPDYNLVLWNKAVQQFCEAAGRVPVAGQPVWGIMPESARESNKRIYDAGLRGEASSFETKSQLRGNNRTTLAQVFPVRGPESQILGVVVKGTDISESVRQSALAQAMAEHVQSPCVAVDAAGNVLLQNTGAARFLAECGIHIATGQCLFGVLASPEHAAIAATQLDTVFGGQPATDSVAVRTASGQEIGLRFLPLLSGNDVVAALVYLASPNPDKGPSRKSRRT